MAQLVCPRCGARDSFDEGISAGDLCVSASARANSVGPRFPGCGPDCKAVEPEPAPDPTPNYVASTGVLSAPDALAAAVRRLKATAPESAEPIKTAEPDRSRPCCGGRRIGRDGAGGYAGSTTRVRQAKTLQPADAGTRSDSARARTLRATGSHRLGVRADLRHPGPGADPRGVGGVLAHVERALRVQAFQALAEAFSHGRRTRPSGSGRERRHRGHRRRSGGRHEDREPQPPLGRRTLPGSGHGRGWHHARHLHHGRAPHL